MLKRFAFVLTGLGLATLAHFTPVGAQTAFPDASGVWTGTLAGGIGLELRLTQDGQNLSGFGTYLPVGGVKGVEFQVTGEETAGGLVLLNTQGRSEDTAKLSVLTVEMALAGDQAQAQVVDGQNQTSTSLSMSRVLPGDPPGAELQAATVPGSSVSTSRQLMRLWNDDLKPFQSYSPQEAYRIDAIILLSQDSRQRYNLHLDVKLAGSLITELAGSWSLDQGAANSPGVLPALSSGNPTYQAGRVAAWNTIITRRSRIILKTPDTLTNLGDVGFDRLQSGQAGASYSTDPRTQPYGWLQTTVPGYVSTRRPSGGTVTLVSP